MRLLDLRRMHRSTLSHLLIALAISCTSCTKSTTTTAPEDTTPADPAPAATPETPDQTPEQTPEQTPVASEAQAHADLQSPSGVAGKLVLRESAEGLVVDGTITGLAPGAHGFHVHDVGECTAPKFESAGGHFDPTKAPHAAPTAAAHHLGDLGNIEADAAGQAHVHAVVADLSLTAGAAGSVVGRSVVVHAKADDMKTQPSGASGDRIACGVIEADAT